MMLPSIMLIWDNPTTQAHLASMEYQAFMKAKDTENLITHLELDVMEEIKE